MAIVVQHKENGRNYILLGASHGMYKALSPSVFGGSFLPREEEASIYSIAVSDAKGTILFFESDLLKVIKIDGIPLNDYDEDLAKEGPVWDEEQGHYSRCPACFAGVSPKDKVCSSCGLSLK